MWHGIPRRLALCALSSRYPAIVNDYYGDREANKRMRRLSTAVLFMATLGLFVTLLFLGGSSAEELDSFTFGEQATITTPRVAREPAVRRIHVYVGVFGTGVAVQALLENDCVFTQP